MTGELFINGTDAYTYGVSMGAGFLEALKATLSFKDDIENDSSLQHGKRAYLSAFYESREVSLTFVVQGANKALFAANEGTFLSVLYNRKLTIKIAGDDNYYRLVYTGKSSSYGHSPSGVICSITAKFTELNPNDRKETQEGDFFVI